MCCRSLWSASVRGPRWFYPAELFGDRVGRRHQCTRPFTDLVVGQRLSDMHRSDHDLTLVVVVDRSGDRADIETGGAAASSESLLATQVHPLADVGDQLAQQRAQLVGQV